MSKSLEVGIRSGEFLRLPCQVVLYFFSLGDIDINAQYPDDLSRFVVQRSGGDTKFNRRAVFALALDFFTGKSLASQISGAHRLMFLLPFGWDEGQWGSKHLPSTPTEHLLGRSVPKENLSR